MSVGTDGSAGRVEVDGGDGGGGVGATGGEEAAIAVAGDNVSTTAVRIVAPARKRPPFAGYAINRNALIAVKTEILETAQLVANSSANYLGFLKSLPRLQAALTAVTSFDSESLASPNRSTVFGS